MLRLRRIDKIQIRMQMSDMEGFAERITGSYGLMFSSIPPQQMIQILLGAEEGQRGITVVQTGGFKISQQAVMDVVNQVINRIIHVFNGSGVYQDRIFLSAALRKLGIRNGNELVKAAIDVCGVACREQELAGLSARAEKLFDKEERYVSGMERLGRSIREWISLVGRPQDRTGKGSTEFLKRTRLRVFAENLETARLEKKIFHIHPRNIYGSLNYYEMPQRLGNVDKAGDLRERMLSAVFVDLVREGVLYLNDLPGKGPRGLLDIRSAAAESVRAGTERFAAFHRAMRRTDTENHRALMQALDDGFRREIRVLKNIQDLSGWQKRDEQMRELKMSRKILSDLLKEHQDEMAETLLLSESKTLREVIKIGEQIQRYIYFLEMRHTEEAVPWKQERVQIIHAYSPGMKMNETARRTGEAETRAADHESILRESGHTDRTAVKLALSGREQKEISQIVKENLREQMGMLTEKVYGKLEQRLSAERRRRGL